MARAEGYYGAHTPPTRPREPCRRNHHHRAGGPAEFPGARSSPESSQTKEAGSPGPAAAPHARSRRSRGLTGPSAPKRPPLSTPCRATTGPCGTVAGSGIPIWGVRLADPKEKAGRDGLSRPAW